MIVRHWDDILRRGFSTQTQPTAATIGVFDGLHRGHMELIRRVTANSPDLTSMAVTFKENPKKSTRSQKPLGNLLSLEQKLDLLEAAGIQVCVLIDFSANFSKMGGYEFISILVQSCGVRTFVVGSDFKCGYRLSTDATGVVQIARSLGSEADIVDPVLLDGDIISSSRIRVLVSEGKMDQALAMLGRPYTLDLRSVRIERNGGTRIICLPHSGVVVPREGTYVVQLVDGGANPTLTASVSVEGNLAWVQQDGCEPQFVRFQKYIL